MIYQYHNEVNIYISPLWQSLSNDMTFSSHAFRRFHPGMALPRVPWPDPIRIYYEPDVRRLPGPFLVALLVSDLFITIVIRVFLVLFIKVEEYGDDDLFFTRFVFLYQSDSKVIYAFCVSILRSDFSISTCRYAFPTAVSWKCNEMISYLWSVRRSANIFVQRIQIHSYGVVVSQKCLFLYIIKDITITITDSLYIKHTTADHRNFIYDSQRHRKWKY